DFADLAAKLSPAVVNVSSDETAGGESEEGGEEPQEPESAPFEGFGEHGGHTRSLASGFIISKDGYVITNDHAIEGNNKITVSTEDGKNYTAKVVGRDEKSDIALLKIQADHDLPVAPLGNSDQVRVGEWVMAIGNPFGFDHSVTVGIVSAKGRFIPPNSFDDFIQTDASINPGNSGGPLINLRGEVIGVNSAIYTRTGSSMGIGFAIPVSLVKGELPQLREYGKVTRGWLGVYIQPITEDLQQSLGLKEQNGALVGEVLPGSPAQKAGVQHGDVIVSFDNQPIVDPHSLPLLVARTPLGHVATLKIVRDRKEMVLPVTITESKDTELASAQQPQKAPRGTPAQFGLRVEDLTGALAHELGLESTQGVLVAEVEPGSRADEAGVRPRDVILEVNRAAVKDVASYQQAVKSAGKGKIVLLLVKRGDDTSFMTLKPEG
ncbi:MAG TPA: DegQ family serine endoprotease, partial [Candidatus Binataceae bacterium]|nr:DegQ family serine endoprotease [Candidatus Binataceae bacterium]